MKSLRYALEGALVTSLIAVFRTLPLDAASGTGGWLARRIGPYFRVAHRRGLKNLKISLPGKTDDEYDNIMLGMWENIGRTFAEYPHLEKIAFERMGSTGEHYVTDVVKKGGPSILIAGHLANWETAAAYAYKLGMFIDLVYRAPNNPYIKNILQKCRTLDGKIKTFPKSSQGMRDIFSSLKSKRHVGILIDQKYNQGLAMDFFGRPAMTSPAFAQLAQRFDCPLLPARVERLNGANFHITVYEPIPTQGRSLEEIITQTHDMLEKWIAERPEQWLWVHNRWREK